MEIETTLQVNKFARRIRQLKNFSRAALLKSSISEIALSALAPVGNLSTLPPVRYLNSFLGTVKRLIISVLPVSPSKRLLFQSGMIAVASIVAMSFSGNATFMQSSMTYASDYIDSYSIPGDILVSDEDGYLLKINPQTDESSRIGLTDFAVHTVESGEVLSAIAGRYGVKVETIMWENNIVNPNSLRIGQTILIPPVDGISYKVAENDTLTKISKKYNVSTESIIAQNNLSSETIRKGQALFLPDAKPLAAPSIATRNPGIGRSSRVTSASPSSASPAVGKMFIYPTIGKITQGYRGGHYALDIADRSKPPVWAAASGTVVTASTGTWGRGYGNYVVIDHGDGIQTLYGHMDSVNVYAGQVVSQGDVVGIMGNTGRVYGVTGIHTHWEVIINGVKVNPINYY